LTKAIETHPLFAIKPKQRRRKEMIMKVLLVLAMVMLAVEGAERSECKKVCREIQTGVEQHGFRLKHSKPCNKHKRKSAAFGSVCESAFVRAYGFTCEEQCLDWGHEVR
jgi:hypothetical protein